MIRSRIRSFVALALALSAASCDTNPVAHVADVPAAHAVRSAQPAPAPTTFRLVPGDEPRETQSEVIGAGGGVLYFGSHAIQVPAGAVSEPTLFTGTQVGDGFLHVELTAHQRDPAGSFTVDVGERGFAKPVILWMSYANASSIVRADGLFILYLADGSVDGRLELVPTAVNRIGRWLYARLDHFSGYAVGEG